MQNALNPILRDDIPARLETERLYLHCRPGGDGAAMNAAVVESAREIGQWLPFADPLPTVEASERFIREAYVGYLQRTRWGYLIFGKDRPDFCLGRVGIVEAKWAVPAFEFGYWLRTSAVGHGYMQEAVQALVDLCIQQFHARRLVIRCHSENERSANIARRLGFVLEATMRNIGRHHATGELFDMHYFALNMPDPN